MFSPTKQPYKFKYLITGITGTGIEKVYLPPIPSEDKILFHKEKRFVRPEMGAQLKKWVKEWRNMQRKDPKYVHAQYDKIVEWENMQWERCRPDGAGVFFYNGYDKVEKTPEIVYLTPFHYWYLTEWKPYFGYPTFRDSDKEVFYWIKYWEEDPNIFGGTLNTIRRWAKSTIMGAWIVYRTTMNFSHNSGMQGETDKKIAKFYKKMVLKPFYKLNYYMQPTYNVSTQQASSIEFDLPPQRSVRMTATESEEKEVLESMIDYRPSGEGEYDGDILNSYVLEEPGKARKTSIYNDEGDGTWDIVKPCLLQGEEICGKVFMGTTVENMTISDKGGRSYKKLFYESDINQKQEDGRTISGLIASFLPGDCALKGYYDSHGRPKLKEARTALMRTRASFKRNPRKLAGWIRKFPLTITEIFYVSPERCEFNSQILQDRLREIDTAIAPFTTRGDIYWEGGVRFGTVKWRHNPDSGWAEVSKLPAVEETNRIGKKFSEGKTQYYPRNDSNFQSGLDPIQFGSTSTGRESRPVQFVKSKYNSVIDGEITDELLEQRAIEKYPYKTNQYVLMMDLRPSNPIILAERVLMICWFFGVSVHVEKQTAGLIIGYFHEWGCSDFILYKYVPEFEKQDKNPTEGTHASTGTIQEYTGAYAWYIDYFGHTIPFRPQVEDALIFDASNTLEHDHTVAAGWTELSGKMKPKNSQKLYRDISEFLPIFDPFGNVIN